MSVGHPVTSAGSARPGQGFHVNHAFPVDVEPLTWLPLGAPS
ncbi:hypothetical protein Ae505Ps2_6193c [Pseudonocardia sp. Ae505_Ps2]|nr:hypothetical protein Ae331Ps2_6250c [Pseudonocardia sp. Ae331_Ps2]OLM08339.1 hypothetical protein Ae505Ps2_6193c [Pseudonocardia sp. Ae505_Ps2]